MGIESAAKHYEDFVAQASVSVLFVIDQKKEKRQTKVNGLKVCIRKLPFDRSHFDFIFLHIRNGIDAAAFAAAAADNGADNEMKRKRVVGQMRMRPQFTVNIWTANSTNYLSIELPFDQVALQCLLSVGPPANPLQWEPQKFEYSICRCWWRQQRRRDIDYTPPTSGAVSLARFAMHTFCFHRPKVHSRRFGMPAVGKARFILEFMSMSFVSAQVRCAR